ncbi:hypothetical protein RAD16_04175 [Bradyrhizobium sp. 18BD]
MIDDRDSAREERLEAKRSEVIADKNLERGFRGWVLRRLQQVLPGKENHRRQHDRYDRVSILSHCSSPAAALDQAELSLSHSRIREP